MLNKNFIFQSDVSSRDYCNQKSFLKIYDEVLKKSNLQEKSIENISMKNFSNLEVSYILPRIKKVFAMRLMKNIGS